MQRFITVQLIRHDLKFSLRSFSSQCIVVTAFFATCPLPIYEGHSVHAKGPNRGCCEVTSYQAFRACDVTNLSTQQVCGRALSMASHSIQWRFSSGLFWPQLGRHGNRASSASGVPPNSPLLSFRVYQALVHLPLQ